MNPGRKTQNTKLFRDQLGRAVQIPVPLKKIISVVPSQTELLYDLGLNEEVIGITKFCIHPEKWFRTKTRIGGTKNLNLEKIASLQPDVIIANKEENTEKQISKLGNHFPVWISDVKNLDNAYEMINILGKIVGKPEKAQELTTKIKSLFYDLKHSCNNSKPDLLRSNRQIRAQASLRENPKLSCVYLIWQNPYMTVGADTFIHNMLQLAGFENVFADRLRYPEISLKEIKERSPQYILLSTEPFPFKQKHVDDLQKSISSSRIILVDGEMFSWYGSRLLKAPLYFNELKSRLEDERMM